MNILTNAFSLQMIPVFPAIPIIEEIYGHEIKELAKTNNLESAIGHADLAAVLTDELGVEIPTNRVPVRVGKDDTLYVAQYTGGRLPRVAPNCLKEQKLTTIKSKSAWVTLYAETETEQFVPML